MARVLPQPTIPVLAKVPSVALMHQLEGTLGGCALTHCTDFDPTTFTAAGTFMDSLEQLPTGTFMEASMDRSTRARR
jgi:hypothetical protein